MTLTPGTRLGPYEIVAAIGAGGMGEVYRATDSHLKRAVAIKVLPASESFLSVADLTGGTAMRRLTFGGNSRAPVWSRDSQRVAFQSDRDGDAAIFWQRTDGTGSAERLTKPAAGTVHVPES